MATRIPCPVGPEFQNNIINKKFMQKFPKLKIRNYKLEIMLFCLVFLVFGFVGRKADASIINKSLNYLSSNNGLVGYWTMDGSKVNWNTGVVTDSSGQGNTGTITNMATSTGVAAGKIGQALNFDGGDDFVNIGAGSSNVNTMAFWVYPKTTTEYFISFDAGSPNSSIFVDDGTVTTVLITSPTIYVNGSVSSTLVANQWQHVVVTTATTVVVSKLEIGRTYLGVMDGLIDEVRVYNRVLSAKEVQALYNSGAAKFNVSPTKYLTDGLVGYWTMDGSKVNWKTGAVTDSSSQNNTGFVTNMATSTGVAAGKIGQALSFDGGTTYVNLSSTSKVNIPGDNLTIAAWIYPIDLVGTTSPRVINVNSATDDYVLAISFASAAGPTNASAIYSAYGTGEIDSPANSISANKWQHIAVVWSNSGGGNSGAAYINGVAVATTTAIAANYGDAVATIGSRIVGAPSVVFPGLIDDVRIYKRLLSATEIKALYNSGAAKFNVSPTKYLTDGLVGYWTMDGSKVNWNTGVVTDSSSQNNTGFVTNMATSTGVAAGKIGQALSFDGVNDLVNVPYAASLNPTSAVTLAAWVRVAASETGYEGIIWRFAGNPFPGYALVLNPNYGASCTSIAGRVGFWVGDNSSRYLCSPSGINNNSWHHIAGAYNGTTAVVYIDGVAVASGARTNGLNQTSQALQFGQSNLSGDFLGTIDEVRIYNRALSAKEIQQLYNAGR